MSTFRLNGNGRRRPGNLFNTRRTRYYRNKIAEKALVNSQQMLQLALNVFRWCIIGRTAPYVIWDATRKPPRMRASDPDMIVGKQIMTYRGGRWPKNSGR
jgi:hypothetical protein